MQLSLSSNNIIFKIFNQGEIINSRFLIMCLLGSYIIQYPTKFAEFVTKHTD